MRPERRQPQPDDRAAHVAHFTAALYTLETARRRTKPRTVDLYDVFCGVLYLSRVNHICRLASISTS